MQSQQHINKYKQHTSIAFTEHARGFHCDMSIETNAKCPKLPPTHPFVLFDLVDRLVSFRYDTSADEMRTTLHANDMMIVLP